MSSAANIDIFRSELVRLTAVFNKNISHLKSEAYDESHCGMIISTLSGVHLAGMLKREEIYANEYCDLEHLVESVDAVCIQLLVTVHRKSLRENQGSETLRQASQRPQ
jgi:hypothetical protein